MKLFTDALLDQLAARAAASPRGRTNHNIHTSADDLVQRFIIVADVRSYFRPHRHRSQAELVIILRGAFDVLSFDDAGTVTAHDSIGVGSTQFAYENPPRAWHTLLARSDGSAFLEVKQGPYDPATAAEFAPFAPPEGDAGVVAYQEWLRRAQPGEYYRS